MKELELESNPEINDDGAALLLNCLANIGTLWLSKQNLSKEMETKLEERARKEGCKVFCT